MQVVRSITGMRRCVMAWRRAARRVALVPTMGALHEGHRSLMRRARNLVGRTGRVVVSIYVNPTQFGPREDLARYPRDLAGDLRLCRAAGVDAVFVPTDATMYPGREDGGYSTYVVEERLSQSMEGRVRPGHFRGVTTIVAKLFLIVGADCAVFGAKDWQQAAVVRRMVRDLNLPVRVVVAPTVRAADGLALSSRNRYLSAEERGQATCLWRGLCAARRWVRAAGGGGLSAGGLRRRLRALIEAEPLARVDYIEFVDGATLEPVRRVRHGTRVALAVRLGRTRLIDNGRL